MGIFQTHLFGQRTNDAFRVTEADRTAWRLFDGLYRRRGWQERDSWGDADYSGNPPLGAAGILPFDASANEFAKYKFLFFLGRNVTDADLYRKLVAYVKDGGTLMLAASHLTVQDAPDGAFVPYNGGDWSELVGVKVRSGEPWHLPHGMKFVKNPGPHWNFQPLTNVWDPDFIEGGFDVPELETTTAKPFVVASDNFIEKKIADCKGIGFVNEIGKGRVVFLASLDSPGAFGVRKLYSFLMAKAMEAVGAVRAGGRFGQRRAARRVQVRVRPPVSPDERRRHDDAVPIDGRPNGNTCHEKHKQKRFPQGRCDAFRNGCRQMRFGDDAV